MSIKPSEFTEYQLVFKTTFVAFKDKEIPIELLNGQLSGALKGSLLGLGMVGKTTTSIERILNEGVSK